MHKVIYPIRLPLILYENSHHIEALKYFLILTIQMFFCLEKFLFVFSAQSYYKIQRILIEITNNGFERENLVGVFSLDCLNLPRKLRKGQKIFHVPNSDYSLQYPTTVSDALCQIVNRIRKQELLLTKNTILYWCVLDQNMKIYSGEKKLKCFSF